MLDTIEAVHSRKFPVRFDQGRHPRAKIGFVVLASEQTVEADCFKLAPPGVGIHLSRIAVPQDVDVAGLKTMEASLGAAAALLNPYDNLDVSCYTCNCATMVIGEKRVRDLLAQGRPGATATTVMTGVVRGLRAVGARKIVVGTPYLDEINAQVLRFLRENGFEVLEIQGLNLPTDHDMVRVEPEFLREFGAGLDRPDADAVFICCGALRTLDIVGALENQLNKPVVVSNQAMMWDCLRLAGVEDRIDGYGRLMQLPGL